MKNQKTFKKQNMWDPRQVDVYFLFTTIPNQFWQLKRHHLNKRKKFFFSVETAKLSVWHPIENMFFSYRISIKPWHGFLVFVDDKELKDQLYYFLQLAAKIVFVNKMQKISR